MMIELPEKDVPGTTVFGSESGLQMSRFPFRGPLEPRGLKEPIMATEKREHDDKVRRDRPGQEKERESGRDDRNQERQAGPVDKEHKGGKESQGGKDMNREKQRDQERGSGQSGRKP